jgi:Helitron helicase-like domain at N-terminus
VSSAGSNSEWRAQNIAEDPYAGAKFFHILIPIILENLFKVRIDGHRVKSGMGILGRVTAYFGLVETQGRGTLHLHLLIWLDSVPTADEIEELLKNPEFRERIVAFIRANIRLYLPGLETVESIQSIPGSKEFAYSRPPHPDLTEYQKAVMDDELRLAKTEQLHTCKPHRCLFIDKSGRITCKCWAPFPRLHEDFMLETGEWGSKRLYEYMNSWNPGILVNARCNNDIKLLTNGHDTKNITYYVTTYAAKKQGKSYNTSAVLAQGYAYHVNHPIQEYIGRLQETSRLLVFRLVHAINREQELAAPMVISYLMGWNDSFRSHTYSPIFLSTFVSSLLKSHSELAQQAM